MFLRIFGVFRCFHPIPIIWIGSGLFYHPLVGGLPWGWTWFLDVVRNPEMIPGSENHFFIQFLSFVWLYITAWWWLEHGFYDFPYTRNNHPNWRTHIFQRGWNHQPDYIDIDLYFLSYSYTCNKWTLAKNQVRLSSWVFRLDVPVSARFPSSKKWWIVLCRCTKSPGELRRRLFLVHPTHIGIMVLTRKYPLVN